MKIEIYRDNLIITADNVKIEEDILTLSGSSEADRKVDDTKYYFRELSRKSFSRSIKLPDDLNLDEVRADHKDGMLKVRIPYKKKEEPKSVRTISIA